MPDAPQSLVMRGLDATATAAVAAATQRAVTEGWARRIWDRDAALWSPDPDVQATIGQRLGWLDLPLDFSDRIAELVGLADGLRAEGCRRALVCGMGGSSLAPWVIARVWPAAPDGIAVAVLDSTDPSAVQAATADGDPGTTLYVIASKSGTTVESASFEAYFWELETERYGRFPRDAAGEHFAIITDPGHSLDQFPHREAYRTVLLNPPDVGGRYSALTYVGLAPAALQGVVLDPVLDEALAMAEACRLPGADNPGVALGAALGALAHGGRDKVTFVIEPAVAPFGAWVEQLIAESTGKQGTGPRADRRRAAGRAGGLHRRPGLRAPGAPRRQGRRRVAQHDRRRPGGPRGGRPPGHRRAHARRPRGRVLPLGVRHGGGRCGPRREPVRRAQRHRVEAQHRPPPGHVPAGRRPARRRPAPCHGGTAGPVRRRRPEARRGRQRGPGPAAAPGPAGAARLPRPAGLHRADAGSRPGAGGHPAAPARRDAAGDDGRLRATFPALDGPAPQGRPADRLLPPAHRRPRR